MVDIFSILMGLLAFGFLYRLLATTVGAWGLIIVGALALLRFPDIGAIAIAVIYIGTGVWMLILMQLEDNRRTEEMLQTIRDNDKK